MGVREQVKRMTKRVLVESGAASALSRLAPPSAVVLIYHSVQHEPEAFAHTIGTGITHPAQAFEDQMEIVARLFTPVTLDQVRQFLLGEISLPRRAVAITFDDGFRDNYEVAAPILDRLGIRAAFYITAGCLATGRSPWFCRLRHTFHAAPAEPWNDPIEGRTWDLADPASRSAACSAAMRHCATLVGQRQEALLVSIEQSLPSPPDPQLDRLMLEGNQVQALHRAGHVVGSHTMSHPNLAHVSLDEARAELQQSQQILQRCLAAAVKHFSYPNPILSPHWSPQTRALTEELGFETAVTCGSETARAGQDPLLIPRVAAPLGVEDFRWALEANFFGHRV